MSRILESLNDRQREAVQATEGYFRIIAGAGLSLIHISEPTRH